jgi:hypothetical protein
VKSASSARRAALTPRESASLRPKGIISFHCIMTVMIMMMMMMMMMMMT